jgi:hypothetical protein
MHKYKKVFFVSTLGKTHCHVSSHSSGVPTLLQCHALTMPFPSPACECTETAQPQSPNTQTIFILRDTSLLMKYALMMTGEMWLKNMKKIITTILGGNCFP